MEASHPTNGLYHSNSESIRNSHPRFESAQSNATDQNSWPQENLTKIQPATSEHEVNDQTPIARLRQEHYTLEAFNMVERTNRIRLNDVGETSQDGEMKLDNCQACGEHFQSRHARIICHDCGLASCANCHVLKFYGNNVEHSESHKTEVVKPDLMPSPAGKSGWISNVPTQIPPDGSSAPNEDSSSQVVKTGVSSTELPESVQSTTDKWPVWDKFIDSIGYLGDQAEYIVDTIFDHVDKHYPPYNAGELSPRKFFIATAFYKDNFKDCLDWWDQWLEYANSKDYSLMVNFYEILSLRYRSEQSHELEKRYQRKSGIDVWRDSRKEQYGNPDCHLVIPFISRWGFQKWFRIQYQAMLVRSYKDTLEILQLVPMDRLPAKNLSRDRFPKQNESIVKLDMKAKEYLAKGLKQWRKSSVSGLSHSGILCSDYSLVTPEEAAEQVAREEDKKRNAQIHKTSYGNPIG